jgi:hypothetical protein
MKKAFVLLLACLMAVNVSAQKVKSSTTTKKTTTSKTVSKKSPAKKKSTSPDGLLQKGTFYFNTNTTNVSFNHFSVGHKKGDKTQSLTRFGLQGTGGYAISEHLGIAAGVGFQYGKMEGSSLSVFSFNGGVRYYVIPNLYLSGMMVVGATSISEGGNLSDLTGDGDDGDDDSGSVSSSMKGHTFGVDLGVGYSIFLTPRIALEPNISYSIGISNKMENKEFKLNSLTFNIGFTIFI